MPHIELVRPGVLRCSGCRETHEHKRPPTAAEAEARSAWIERHLRGKCREALPGRECASA